MGNSRKKIYELKRKQIAPEHVSPASGRDRPSADVHGIKNEGNSFLRCKEVLSQKNYLQTSLSSELLGSRSDKRKISNYIPFLCFSPENTV